VAKSRALHGGVRFMSRASPLVEAYLAALPLVEVAIVGAGRRCRIIAGEIPPGEPVAQRFFFRSSHAELLFATIGAEGLSGRPAAALGDAVVAAAGMLGARYWTASDLRAEAERQVDEIVERIKAANHRGALKVWNARFKSYRLEQKASGGKAIGYWQYLELAVTLPTVRSIAASGRAI
jgi:hypothetical protein